jgi:tripartite-type tricarboxylate transporter receptor subunit TctC
MIRRNILAGSVLTGLVLAASFSIPGYADTAYPSKSVTVVVPFPPGGLADTVARPLAQAMAQELKQPVVVENKGGAGGAIGIGHAAKAAPDGYTALLSLSSMTTLPVADALLGRKPLFQMSQLIPVARITADPTVLAVRADSPWQTIHDFIKDVRAKPDAYNYGSSGNYGTMHVPFEMLKAQADLHILHVPYTGAGPAIVGLLGGHIQAVATGPATVLGHIKNGKLRALAHWGNGPLAALPGVPSLTEAGYPAEYAQWSGLFVPAGTPSAVVDKLRDAARKAVEDPAVQKSIQGAGSPIQYQDAPAFQQYVDADAKKMKAVVEKIGKVN